MNLLQWALAIGGVVLLTACFGPVIGPEGPGETRETSIGAVLVDSEGMTLYTYDADEPGMSACTGFCAIYWPPAEAEGAAPKDGFTLIARENGAMQWAYEGRPLYGFLEDHEPGDVTGDGADGAWHAARP